MNEVIIGKVFFYVLRAIIFINQNKTKRKFMILFFRGEKINANAYSLITVELLDCQDLKVVCCITLVEWLLVVCEENLI